MDIYFPKYFYFQEKYLEVVFGLNKFLYILWEGEMTISRAYKNIKAF